MDRRIDKILEDTSEIKQSIVEIQKDLQYHIKRTDLLEKMVTDDIPPIKRHVDRVEFALMVLKWVIGLGGVSGAIAALKAFLGL